MTELDRLHGWIGREETVEDVLALGPARGMVALLDRDPAWIRVGAPLPPLWHWFYLHEAAAQSRLGPDGHPRRGDFLPPVSLPRRMWAGGRVRFGSPLLLGSAARRRSTVARIEAKHGRQGPFVLVTVRHIVEQNGVAVEEEQQLAYREPRGVAETAPSAVPPVVLPAAAWVQPFVPSPVALFRFSALTFNGHRIHYDQPYATRVERYPGLVVHAPLLAVLLLDAAVRHAGRTPVQCEYRALAPLFADAPLTLEGEAPAGTGRTTLRARGVDGTLAMSAAVEWGE